MSVVYTSGNGTRTVSPARIWSTRRSAFDMKLVGRRKVQASPDSRTESSASIR
jgi:hypothetical protein